MLTQNCNNENFHHHLLLPANVCTLTLGLPPASPDGALLPKVNLLSTLSCLHRGAVPGTIHSFLPHQFSPLCWTILSAESMQLFLLFKKNNKDLLLLLWLSMPGAAPSFLFVANPPPQSYLHVSNTIAHAPFSLQSTHEAFVPTTPRKCFCEDHLRCLPLAGPVSCTWHALSSLPTLPPLTWPCHLTGPLFICLHPHQPDHHTLKSPSPPSSLLFSSHSAHTPLLMPSVSRL